jgi:hypothetical protein
VAHDCAHEVEPCFVGYLAQPLAPFSSQLRLVCLCELAHVMERLVGSVVNKVPCLQQ